MCSHSGSGFDSGILIYFVESTYKIINLKLKTRLIKADIAIATVTYLENL